MYFTPSDAKRSISACDSWRDSRSSLTHSAIVIFFMYLYSMLQGVDTIRRTRVHSCTWNGAELFRNYGDIKMRLPSPKYDKRLVVQMETVHKNRVEMAAQVRDGGNISRFVRCAIDELIERERLLPEVERGAA